MSDFRVSLDIFRGPLDLLLYLVRKHEVEIVDLPIAPITEQFLHYLEALKQLDVNAVGDFVEMASTLIEIKSRSVLPRADEVHEPMDDPREELVQRLLQYKKFRDAASMLEERGRKWQERYARQASDFTLRRPDPAEEPIHGVELWDLVSALGRVLKEHDAAQPSNIVFDDTPVHVYMQQIHQRLKASGRVAFSDIFQPPIHKSAVIGMFLAILELARHHGVRAEQNELFGEIWLLPGEAFQSRPELGSAVTSAQPAN